jgi:hypothetical protein
MIIMCVLLTQQTKTIIFYIFQERNEEERGRKSQVEDKTFTSTFLFSWTRFFHILDSYSKRMNIENLELTKNNMIILYSLNYFWNF